MPNAFGREIPTWMLGAAALCAVLLAYKQFSGGDDAPVSSAKRKAPAKLTAASDLYTKEDTTAKFAVYQEPVQNAFLPLIKGTGGHAVASGLVGEITGGEANWFYTGNIEVNGQVQALLENTASGDSVYLSKGEKFKGISTVVDITPEQVVFMGPTGRVVAKLNDPTELKRGSSVPANGGLAPMNPASGMIGGMPGALPGTLPGIQTGVDPNTGQPVAGPMTIQPDPNQGNNGRRRGGRGRGRGGFGGGGFGN